MGEKVSFRLRLVLVRVNVLALFRYELLGTLGIAAPPAPVLVPVLLGVPLRVLLGLTCAELCTVFCSM